MKAVIGLKKHGLDFESLDGKPSIIFILLLSPAGVSGPHVQFLAEIARLLESEKSRNELLNCSDAKSIYHFFIGQK